ncbi:MAG: metallophosphoesterase family protein [Burkholderiaceae bacterium]
MRTLVHLSDLHFGRIAPELIAPLARIVRRIDPDLVVVSGDLTQRARSAEFREARTFLAALPTPQIVVPGNHDIPLHNVFARFLHPLDKFRRYITANLEPFHLDQEIAVLGVNTARSLAIKDGRINAAQFAQVRARLCGLDSRIVKIVVTHHPFDLPEDFGGENLVGRAGPAMRVFADCGADVLLAGHMHVAHAGTTAARYPIGAYSALVVQAGTATSTRGRGEANSFNVLRIDSPSIAIDRYRWMDQTADFALAGTESFERVPGGWTAAGPG